MFPSLVVVRSITPHCTGHLRVNNLSTPKFSTWRAPADTYVKNTLTRRGGHVYRYVIVTVVSFSPYSFSAVTVFHAVADTLVERRPAAGRSLLNPRARGCSCSGAVRSWLATKSPGARTVYGT